MRTETSNTWEEGLVMDLHPLSTPNNVLTDCLNGTFLTYNGNEFSLQNDMGNYKLKNCRLKPNYIPVGVKEYAGILYIVSQNPLTNKVEIGSYPSPLYITEVDPTLVENELTSILEEYVIEKNEEGGEYNTGYYNNLVTKASRIVFNGDEYKLNPGDEYCLMAQADSLPYKYETIEYHILDEDSNFHLIPSNKIKIDTDGEPKDFEHISWTIPGWLSLSTRLAELSVAGINVRAFYIPKNSDGEGSTAYFTFNLRLNIDDEILYGDVLQALVDSLNNNTQCDLSFRVYIERLQSEGKWESLLGDEDYIEFKINVKDDVSTGNCDISLQQQNCTEWYGEAKTFWKNISGKITSVSDDDLIKVKMQPVLAEYKENDALLYKIVYDNLTQELIFDLASAQEDDWNIGTNRFQYRITDDEVYINTDITGPLITTEPIKITGVIRDINGEVVNTIIFSDEGGSYSGIGENSLRIPFENGVEREEIYTIEFIFESNNDVFAKYTRILITSEVFNDFSKTLLYDKDIRLDQWISQYWKHNNTKVTLKEKPTVVINTESVIDTILYDGNESPKSGDRKYIENEEYNTFFPEENPDISKSIIYRKGYNCDLSCNLTIEKDLMSTDGLWSNFNPDSTVQYLDANTEEYIDLKLEENTETSDNFDYTGKGELPAYIEKEFNYTEQDRELKYGEYDRWCFADQLNSVGSPLEGNLYDYFYSTTITIDGKEHLGWYGSFYKNNYEFYGNKDSGRYDSEKDNTKDLSTTLRKVLSDYKLPCMLLEVHYTGTDLKNYWRYIHTIGPKDDKSVSTKNDCIEVLTNWGYLFDEKKSSVNRYAWFVVFGNSNNSDSVVLVPLHANVSDSYDIRTVRPYFKKFCKKMYLTPETDVTLTDYDVYLLSQFGSSKKNNMSLALRNFGSFESLNYTRGENTFDLETESGRIGLVDHIQSTLTDSETLVYTGILSNAVDITAAKNGFIEAGSPIVIDGITFDENSYPYKDITNHDGMETIDSIINKCSSHWNDDWLKWKDNPVIGDDEINSVYCTEDIDDTSLIEDLNECRNPDSTILQLKNESEDAKWLYWKVLHNDDTDGNADRRHTALVYGGLYNENYDFILDKEWPWIKE